MITSISLGDNPKIQVTLTNKTLFSWLLLIRLPTIVMELLAERSNKYLTFPPLHIQKSIDLYVL